MSAEQTAAIETTKTRDVWHGLTPEECKSELASLRSQVAQELSDRRHVAGIKLNLGDIDEEYVPSLKTIQSRMRIYDRMANDPVIRGQLRAIGMTMISAVRWKVEGGSTRARELVKNNLLRQGPRRYWMGQSWIDFLYESMGCLVHGFAPFGISWSRPVDGLHVVSRLTWLHPRSIDEDGWDIGEGDVFRGIRRSYMDGSGAFHSREHISADDLFLVCWDRRGPNFEGNAFIRPFYRPWMLNEMAEKIDIIDLQNRGVGIPVAKLSGAGGRTERDTLIEILKSLRGGSKERAFIVLQNEEEIKYLLSEGQSKDAQPILQHHRQNIVKGAGTEYFEQGSTATGSRAGASALATGFFINVDGIRTVLEDQFNYGAGDQPGIVERLVMRNFGPDEDMPRIVGSRVSPTEQLDNVPLIQDAVAKGVIPPNLNTANAMLEKLGWPVLTPQEWDQAVQIKQANSNPMTLGPGSPALGGPGRPDSTGQDPRGRDDKDSRRMAMQDQIGYRPATETEKRVCALAQMDRGLRSYEAAYAARILKWRDLAIEKIVQSIRERGAKILREGISAHGSTTELRNDLLHLRHRIANFGRGQLNDELRRQGVS